MSSMRLKRSMNFFELIKGFGRHWLYIGNVARSDRIALVGSSVAFKGFSFKEFPSNAATRCCMVARTLHCFPQLFAMTRFGDHLSSVGRSCWWWWSCLSQLPLAGRTLLEQKKLSLLESYSFYNKAPKWSSNTKVDRGTSS